VSVNGQTDARSAVPLSKAFARCGVLLGLIIASAVPGMAGDRIYDPFEPATHSYTADFGLRFWYGRSSTGKNLYDNAGSLLVSRLTYGDLSIFAAEAYTRFDLDRRWFLKGYVGGGALRKGNLKDEDFPPVVAPYSATFSIQQNGTPIYLNVDAGANIFYGPDFRIGLFGGFHYLNQNISAFGCQQTAFNPSICGAFPLPNQVMVITQDNNWYAMRVGMDATVEFDRFRLSVEAAWLPSVWLHGTDAHWLRISAFPGDFTGPVTEEGKGRGYQLEGFLSYRVTPALSLGVGARYWSMHSTGLAHFENHVVGVVAVPQPVEWTASSYGMFVQMSLKMGPYSVLDVH
jgi:outer membrane protease